MKLVYRLLLITLASVLLLPLLAQTSNAKGNPPDVLLAQIYQHGVDVRQYLVSEKFDGVRAIWDGKVFHTRNGNLIAAPAVYPRLSRRAAGW